MNKWIGFKHNNETIRELVDEWVKDPKDPNIIEAIKSADVSEVSDMSNLFRRCFTFNVDISKWDVSNVTDMSGMFNDIGSFNQDLSNWKVSNVKDMSYMFFNASSFNQDISKWDVSNVTNINSMFRGAREFNQDLSNWDVSNTVKVDRVFEKAEKFSYKLKNWIILNPKISIKGFNQIDISKEDVNTFLSNYKAKFEDIKNSDKLNDKEKFIELKKIKSILNNVKNNWRVLFEKRELFDSKKVEELTEFMLNFLDGGREKNKAFFSEFERCLMMAS